MKTLILLTLFAIFQSVCVRTTGNSTATVDRPVSNRTEIKMTNTNDNLQKVLQLTLDLPKLQPYLHPEEPNRKPLHLISNDKINKNVKLEKFGEPVKFVSEADAKAKDIPAIEVTSIEVEGKTASVAFRYRVEGIRGKASFKLNDEWTVVSSEITEN